MYIRFDDIDFDSRLWIYQADRSLTDQEVSLINQTLEAAIDGWEAHNQSLLASGKVFHNRFVVLAVDESHEMPSGCSIDKSVHWLQELGGRLNVDFFDRSVAYLDASKAVQTLPVAAVKQAIADEVLFSNTPVFDNLVSTKAQWMKRWKVPADQTWLKRFFKEENA
ncbi:hypothetical protein [Persicitalea jodogahamensis]|uniref:ABC transporter ATPase n=1 Tax=Persicitalea jodogahamensis TaxID=402147 RepID=A0A8J3D2X1_9BACT|nr:hypothetical protein [Persicitalea jodogahamensis]GHB51870.1 hypothetical protein GCM10007390_00560 [Persicitalea jodogahamensis]